VNDLFKPAFVELHINETDYIELIKELLKRECGVNDIDVYLSIDDETGFVRVVVDESTTSEEDSARLFEKGYNIQDGYLMTVNILQTIFETENVRSYIDMNEYEAMCENNDIIIPIQLGVTDYLKHHNKISVKTPKDVISAIAIDDPFYPCIQIHVGGEIAVITEFNSVNESICTHVYNKANDCPLDTFEW
jgi:hypothetical protein